MRRLVTEEELLRACPCVTFATEALRTVWREGFKISISKAGHFLGKGVVLEGFSVHAHDKARTGHDSLEM